MAMKRGYSLLELVVSIFLAVAAGTLVVSLFMVGRRTSEATYASYLVSRDTELGIGWLRRDLQNAALTSLRVYPGKDDKHPGLSFSCCTPPEEPGQPQLNRYGAPRWSSQVFYTLEKDGDNSPTANLVRWARKYDELLPLPSDHPPAKIEEEKHKRTILTGLLQPKVNLKHAGDEGETDEHGGFRVSFVRRQGGEDGEEKLTDENPGEVPLKGGDVPSTTRLVEIELRRLHVSNTGQPSVFAITFRVCPRY